MNKDDYEKVKDLSHHLHQFIGHKLDEGFNAIEIAGVLQANALMIYKTVLSNNDYQKMVDKIWNQKDQIKPFLSLGQKAIH